jgi:hypothetical protein
MVPQMCEAHPCRDESRDARDVSVAPTVRRHSTFGLVTVNIAPA